MKMAMAMAMAMAMRQWLMHEHSNYIKGWDDTSVLLFCTFSASFLLFPLFCLQCFSCSTTNTISKYVLYYFASRPPGFLGPGFDIVRSLFLPRCSVFVYRYHILILLYSLLLVYFFLLLSFVSSKLGAAETTIIFNNCMLHSLPVLFRIEALNKIRDHRMMISRSTLSCKQMPIL